MATVTEIDYDILKAPTTTKLVAKMREARVDGWEPHGSLETVRYTTSTWFYQPVTRKIIVSRPNCCGGK